MTEVVNLFIRSITNKSYRSDMKYHTTQNTIFSVVSRPLIVNMTLFVNTNNVL